MEYHHLSLGDMAYGYELRNMVEELKNGLDSIESKTERICKKITAVQFLDDYKNLNDTWKALISPFLDTIKGFKKDISLYFQQATNNDILEDLRYKSDAIDIYSKFAYFDALISSRKGKIDAPTIDIILKEKLLPLYFVLQSKTLVVLLDSYLHKYLLEQPYAVELFVSEKDIKNERHIKTYFPDFTDEEINEWISNYLSQEHCNTNYLHCLLLHRNGYKLFPKTILSIKKRYKEITDSLSKDSVMFSNNLSVTINPEQTEPKTERRENNTVYFSFSGKWILDNQDYPTLLNNFIYLFELVDHKFRINYTYNPNNDGTIYTSMRTQHEHEYGSMIFDNLQIRQQGFFMTYVSFLRNACKINIEDIFKWFFGEYLPQEFGISGITLSLDPISNSALSRCRNVFIQIERLLKQYMVYVDNGEFSKELYEATRGSFKFFQYKTIVSDKYYILNKGSELPYLLFLLFSDQSGLCYISNELEAENFTILLARNRLTLESFPNYDKPKLEELLAEGVIKKLEDGTLAFPSTDYISICHQLYSIGFLSRGHLSQKEQMVVTSFLTKGFLGKYSALLSPQESDLFSYFLNDEKFSNALHLRNAYEHGELDNEPESVHETNYLIGLRFLALAIIKINDDLCLKDDEDKAEGKK